MSAALIYRKVLAANLGSDVENIANVIFTSRSNAAERLRNLMKRVECGEQFGCGDSLDTILVNGEQTCLSILD